MKAESIQTCRKCKQGRVKLTKQARGVGGGMSWIGQCPLCETRYAVPRKKAQR